MLSTAELLEALEGNRRLTVRTIEAFPEEKLFDFTAAEPMRPFSKMITEILAMEKGYVRGIALNEWDWDPSEFDIKTKSDLLDACSKVRHETLELWGHMTEEQLEVVMKDPFFGPEMSHFDRLWYGLENEIHHRGQGYVYLRALGIEPPAFYER